MKIRCGHEPKEAMRPPPGICNTLQSLDLLMIKLHHKLSKSHSYTSSSTVVSFVTYLAYSIVTIVGPLPMAILNSIPSLPTIPGLQRSLEEERTAES